MTSGEVSPQLSLARYIRDHAFLKGTKISCNQGGCGACVVTTKVPDLISGTMKVISVNSVIFQLSIFFFIMLRFYKLYLFNLIVFGSCSKLWWLGNYNCWGIRNWSQYSPCSRKIVCFQWNTMWLLQSWNGYANE